MAGNKRAERFAGTCCFIDFDGTLANSLIWYNAALDEMFRGKVTDKPYSEIYKDFGDAYEIIPGSPWKSILMNLCRYLAKEHIVTSSPIEDELNIVRSTTSNDIGFIDAMLRVAYDLAFIDYDPDANIAIYENEEEAVCVVLNTIATAEDVLFANERAVRDGKTAFSLFVPHGYVALSQEAHSHFDDAFLYTSDVESKLTHLFNEHACRILSDVPYEQLAIEPVIRFCREYKEQGGTLVIHSGSNAQVIETMMDVLGIADLFSAHLCSDMLSDVDASSLGAWGYKTKLLERLLCEFPKERYKSFVVGDTKGDAFGAYETQEPFALIWRGYPSDPRILSGSNGSLEIETYVDMRQEEVVEKLIEHNAESVFACDEAVHELLNFAELVKCGEIQALRLSTE